MANIKIDWPAGLTVQGQLAFPLKSEQEIEALKEWRAKKGIKKPKYPDKIGGTLILNQLNYDKAYEYLVKTYLPFVDTLYKETDGEKGIEPDQVKMLLEQAKKRKWLSDSEEKPNMPIRALTDKDRENMRDYPGVAKLAFSGPYEEDLGVKAIIVTEDKRTVVSLDDLVDEGILPEGRTDSTKLWWGSGWNFRTSLRFNAYDKASVGVTAYANTLYLLPHLGLPVVGGSSDAAVLEDGDDADWAE